MKALILADIEGIAGIYSLNNNAYCAEMYAKEVEVHVQALKNNGVQSITLCDAHNDGEILRPYAAKMSNVTFVAQLWNLNTQTKYDFAMLVGFHGMRGSRSKGLLSHTIRDDIRAITVNGVEIGEVEIYSRWLGYQGIPVVMVSGDSEAVYESNMFNAHRLNCCVKTPISTNYYNLDEIYNKIRVTVDSIFKIDWFACLSKDCTEVVVSIVDEDLYKQLEVPFPSDNDKYYFSNCYCFVSYLPKLVSSLSQIQQEIWNANCVFVKEMKETVKGISRNLITDQHTIYLLNKNLLHLSGVDRDYIRAYIKELVFQQEN